MPYVDVKVTVWERYFYSDECDIKTLIPGEDMYPCMDDHTQFTHSETLYDTVEQLSYEDNGNQSTIEIYDDNGTQLWTNEPIEIKRDNKIDTIIEKK